MLRKYIPDPSHVLEAPSIELKEDLSFKVQPVGIIDQKLKELRNKVILRVKVLWRSDVVEEMTWETKFFHTFVCIYRKCYVNFHEMTIIEALFINFHIRIYHLLPKITFI